MANLPRASDAYVSKTDEATAAEVSASSTRFVRGLGLWPGECENALWLAKLGLSSGRPAEAADPLTLDTSFVAVDPAADQLVTQVNEVLSKPRLLGPIPSALGSIRDPRAARGKRHFASFDVI
ncbi:hypothetical protein [Pendulispora albinea]|uniref:Uncharacterized protein n=1 Tax=Pendulispora albinea TaxID=2741071 RepID=A0ABZ2LR26_9BACT